MDYRPHLFALSVPSIWQVKVALVVGTVFFTLGIASSGADGVVNPSTDYFVSSSVGSDNNSGLSGTPWKTLATVAKRSFKPGDRVLLKRGDAWSEGLVFPASGSPDSPVVLGAYGEGPLPLIKGSMPVMGWVSAGNGIYKTPVVTWANGLLEDGLPLKKASDLDLIDGKWYSDKMFFYYRPRFGTPAEHILERCSKGNILSLINKSHVVIENIHIFGANVSGIYISGCRNIVISHCTIKSSANVGIQLTSKSKGEPCEDITIEKNLLSWNANGIYLIGETVEGGLTAASRVTVRDNKIEFTNYSEVWGNNTKDGHAIGLQHVNESYFGRNEIYSNYTGICVWSTPLVGASRNMFVYNYIHHNQRYGIVQGGEGTNSSTGNVWAYNVVAFNGSIPGNHGGLRINRSQSPGNIFLQNTLIGNDINIYLYSLTDNVIVEGNLSLSPTQRHVLIEGQLGSNGFENNLYYPDTLGSFAVGSTRSLGFKGWQEKTGKDRSSLSVDPILSSPLPKVPQDFRPVRNSPVLGKGSARIREYLKKDFLGNSIPQNPSIGAIEPSSED